MAVIKLVPRSAAAIDASGPDRALSALNRAIAIIQEDSATPDPEGGTLQGAIVILWRVYEDGTGEESWVSAGLNQIEAVGVLHKTMHDIEAVSLYGPADEESDEGDVS